MKEPERWWVSFYKLLETRNVSSLKRAISFECMQLEMFQATQNRKHMIRVLEK